MNLKISALCLFALTVQAAWGQAKLRKMPAIINHSPINNYAPYISLDGNSMVYIADVAEDNALTMCYTAREGVSWKEPITLPKSVNIRLNFLRGFALSPDGKILYTSNNRSNGLGGFDIYSSQYTGATWAEPVNVALPVNSRANEACPSISVDGNTMYFMRCEKMDYQKADGCRIFMATKKSNGVFDNPVELPATINTGNSQTPRIMGDSETLVFSSNQFPGNKGGMDLYLTKFTNGQWSTPIALDFANTAKDDQYVSASSLGRYLLKDSPGQRSSELVEMLFPPDVRPKGVIKIEGSILSDNAASAYVTIFNTNDQRKVFSTRPAKDGTFVSYVKEGSIYELSVDPEKDNYTFFSKTFDLTGDKFSLIEKVDVTLKAAESGDEIALDGIAFKQYSSEITPGSTQELRRLERLIEGNPGKSFSILVTMEGFRQDSVRSNPDLTETVIDTVHFSVVRKSDSMDSLSLKQPPRDSILLKYKYDNDRTLKQAKAISDYLVRSGISPARLASSGRAIPGSASENGKVLVKVVIH
jgi:outer membrane protein OmpA-like peptidoglycan-associated protein